jgi:phosphatidate phosphatase APP1
MASWQKVLNHFAADIENHFDSLKYRLAERLGSKNPIMIQPYRGFGSEEKLYLKGRVLENKGITPPESNDSLWENLVNMYRRFESNEIPHARVLARFQEVEQEIVADEEGFFEVWFEPKQPLKYEQLWHTVELELLSPIRPEFPTVLAEGQVFIPPPTARFGVISDVDDTVLRTDATSVLRMARNVFLANARTRLPFKGVAAFYRALYQGIPPNIGPVPPGGSTYAYNPLFYVSSSPWNLYDLLSDFFNLQDIPIGPILFLRDWGLTEEEILPTGHRQHKLKTIHQIIQVYSRLPFILIGDSGQEDPEIYSEVVRLYPDRILAIYIRNVSHDLKRPDAIRALAKEVTNAGSTLILADDTLPMAQHAAQQGWISPAAVPSIEVEKEADEAPPSPIETLLGEGEKPEAPKVVIETDNPKTAQKAVESGEVREAMESSREEGQKPPTVVVKGEEKKPERD